MFTGIIEGLGRVKRCHVSGDSARLVIDLGPLADGVKPGDSVAVDGACLTAARVGGQVVECDVSRETLNRTTLGDLKSGEQVNLERALRVGDRLGGHFVLGHVDGVGTISAIEKSPGQWTLKMTAPPEIMSRLVLKGSIAVSGISLTVASLSPETFTVAIIPHTLENTALRHKSVGDRLNLELDVIGKYVERLLAARQEGDPSSGAAISEGFLEQHGFK